MRLRIIRVSGPAGGEAEPDGTQRVIGRETLVIGRGSDCDWVLPDPERLLSKRHCEVAFQGTVFVLRDTSTNGVFLNEAGQPLGAGKTAVLRHGDRFRAAGYAFRVEMLEADADGPRPAPRAINDPGSPLDGPAATAPWAMGGQETAPADAFALSGPGSFDLPGGTGGFDSDWGQDSSGTGDGMAAGDGLAHDRFGDGFGSFDLPAGTAAPTSAIPESFDFGALTAPPPEDPWQSPDPAPDPAPAAATAGPQKAAAADLAAVMIETLVRIDRQTTAIALSLGLPAEVGSPADRLPAAAGPGMVEALARMPAAEGSRLLSDFGDMLVARCETVLARLDATRAGAHPEPASAPAPDSQGGPSSLEEDPFE